jgi:chromosomal replication initiation ATPase DnaA
LEKVWETFAVWGVTFSSAKELHSVSADAWDRIKGSLAVKLSEGAYQNWISRTAFGSFRDGELTVRVPNETTEAWIRQEYGTQVQAAIDELHLPIRKVRYTS